MAVSGWIILAWAGGIDHLQAGDRITFDKKTGQVEVGGPFVGAEFHQSRPLPSRISFYAPVANSVDLSTDYWERGSSTPMTLGLQLDDGKKIRLGTEGWKYTLSPNTVTFRMDTVGVSCAVRYEFCLTEPSMVVTMTFVNRGTASHGCTVFTQLSMSLRTCQTYARKDSARIATGQDGNWVFAEFPSPETDSAAVFVMNAGVHPEMIGTDAVGLGVDDSGASAWFHDRNDLSGIMTGASGGTAHTGRAVCACLYRKTLRSGDSLVIIQLIGSCRSADARSVLNRLKRSWRHDADAYNAFVASSVKACPITTADSILDRSVGWASAMLASNRHYINGAVVPMPCPAEYNFFFTHDVLLTDLGAVHFDLARVKHDLDYIVSLARDSVIPHAYYWRDDGMKTEWCPPDNWNHLWFILTSCAYIRHTHDMQERAKLLPFVTKSLDMLLTQKRADGLLYAKHPDWWDIGNVEGPRAYITALAIRAIGEYAYLASMTTADVRHLSELEAAADTMKRALVERLWDDRAEYLLNENGTEKDRHFYAGSLVAGAYGVLDRQRSLQMARSAARTIVDPKLGVRTVAPADFHLDSVIAYYHLAGKEAGEPYFYANGGVWPHTTAWYIWVLNAAGEKDEACAFLKRTLAIDGIIDSPNGQPAMYEYRYADPSSPRYGQIDKPTFMWAAGFFLQSLYRVYGVSENEWNLSFTGRPSETRGEVRLPLLFRNVGVRKRAIEPASRDVNATVFMTGNGPWQERMLIGNRSVPSAVLPLDAADAEKIRITYGSCRTPYLEAVNAVVHHVESAPNGLQCVISSYDGHRTMARFVCPRAPRAILCDGRPVSSMSVHPEAGAVRVECAFVASTGRQTLEMCF